MSKTTRYFELIQLLRGATRPVLARELAEALEVSVRTIYRDIASLQAMQTPILGEAGVGYVMRKGYDLPPINFDTDEAEAVAVGLSLVARTGDRGLWEAAARAARKLQDAAPGTQRLVTSSCGVQAPPAISPSDVRAAIRAEQKLRIVYADVDGRESTRVIWPLVILYYVNVMGVVGWCELRSDLRHFRLDRVLECSPVDAYFNGKSDALIARWEAEEKHNAVTTRALGADF